MGFFLCSGRRSQINQKKKSETNKPAPNGKQHDYESAETKTQKQRKIVLKPT